MEIFHLYYSDHFFLLSSPCFSFSFRSSPLFTFLITRPNHDRRTQLIYLLTHTYSPTFPLLLTYSCTLTLSNFLKYNFTPLNSIPPSPPAHPRSISTSKPLHLTTKNHHQRPRYHQYLHPSYFLIQRPQAI